jgi:peptidoglycan hydrolase-like protein with peptidoglycan-binding domain
MNTTKALQRHYKTKVDGIISGQIKTNANKNIYSIRWGIGGSQLVRALQKDLGVKVDGYLGPQTIRALQAKLGVAITGIIQPIDPTTYALQKRLNEGTLWKNGTIGS